MKKHYALQKLDAEGNWHIMGRFDNVEELNDNLGKLLDGKDANTYRGVLYDGDMKVGWKDFKNTIHKTAP